MFIKSYFDVKKYLVYLAYFSFLYSLFMVFTTSFQPIRTDDLFFHLKVGEILTNNTSFPKEDPFLFTKSEDINPLYHEWLFQVIVYNVLRITNLYFLRFFHLSLVILILIILWNFLGIFINKSYSKALILSLFIIFSYQRLIQFRPHLFSILFFYLLISNFIQGEKSFNKKRIFFSVILSLIWCNMHSVALIIFPFWFIYIFTGFIFKKYKEYNFDVLGQTIGFILSLSVMSLNPLGLNYFFFYFIGNKRNPYKFVIDEWGRFNPFSKINDFLPISSPYLNIIFLALSFFTAVFLIICIIKILKKTSNYVFFEIYISIFSIISLLLMFYAVRFVYLSPLPIILILHIFLNLSYKNNILNSLMIFILSLLPFLHFHLENVKIYKMPLDSLYLIKKYFEWDIDKVKYLDSAVKFIKNNKIKGNIYNPYYMGGCLSFYLYPEIKIFFDGRFEHYSKHVNVAAHDIQYCIGNFSELIKYYKIDYFLLPKDDSFKTLKLYLDKNATCIYQDNLAEIYKTA